MSPRQSLRMNLFRVKRAGLTAKERGDSIGMSAALSLGLRGSDCAYVLNLGLVRKTSGIPGSDWNVPESGWGNHCLFIRGLPDVYLGSSVGNIAAKFG